MSSRDLLLFPFFPKGIAPDRRDRHARFLLGAQRDDGGFGGRSGESDVYYTSFALRGLRLLGKLEEAKIEPASCFIERYFLEPGILAAVEQNSFDLVHLTALIYCCALLRTVGKNRKIRGLLKRERPNLLQALQAFRDHEGGYTLHPCEGHASLYCSFLATSAFDLLGAAVPDLAATQRFVAGLQNPDHGFRNHRAGAISSTNPTSTAVFLLHRWKMLKEPQAMAEFFMQARQGPGFRATPNAPLPDLATTFSSLLALLILLPGRTRAATLGSEDLHDFIVFHEVPSGGFRTTLLDQEVDAEYTFYGLCALSALAFASLSLARQLTVVGGAFFQGS